MSRVTDEQIQASAMCDHDWKVHGMRRQCTKCFVGERLMSMEEAAEQAKPKKVASTSDVEEAVRYALGPRGCICEYGTGGRVDHDPRCELLRALAGID